MKSLNVRWIVFCFAAMLAQAVLPAAAQGNNESPPSLKASRFIPGKLLAGPSYRIRDRVANDGYMNRYEITSRFGDLTTVSIALLLTRIDEIRALEKMETL